MGQRKQYNSLIQSEAGAGDREKALQNQHLITALPAGMPRAAPNEWGFSNKMLDLTRHIDKVRKA